MPTIYEYHDSINIALGGSYVNGILTPPPGYTGSVTQWTRYVQEYANAHISEVTINPLSQNELDSLHYGGYGKGTAQGEAYARAVEATGWTWTSTGWVRSDTELPYIPPDPIPVVPDPAPVTTISPEDVATLRGPQFALPLLVMFGGLYAIKHSQKSKQRRKK